MELMVVTVVLQQAQEATEPEAKVVEVAAQVVLYLFQQEL